MQHRTVHDVMTQEVVTTRPDTPFKEIAALFHRNDVTAVPVVDAQNRPLGMVSEADLIRKQVVMPDEDRDDYGRTLRWKDQARAEAETAGGLMTSPAITAHPGWSIPQAARAMEKHHVKRLPVVDEVGRMIGIVSRRDLLQVFMRHDPAIREEIVHDVLGETLWLPEDSVQVHVHDGVVTLTGRVPRKSLIAVAERLCRSVDGVVSVHQTLDFTEDDTRIDLERPSAHGSPHRHHA
ncbi:CBS domain-containing protein [Streptomyces sp. GC420]|uniref:CBS domain-containing protein n=1 Tax=Streptomyces sp. GC420 TaxID=2697568 RepID=UPI0014152966|nr:CBS domain-containing protein [Streptomyces sp. GC420]NBM16927.1 CBS domain-containing protein [Streptomyces sp. GC420]